MDKVGLVYHPAYLEHDTGAHPESAERLRDEPNAVRPAITLPRQSTSVPNTSNRTARGCVMPVRRSRAG